MPDKNPLFRLAPASFTIVMGTGAFAMATLEMSTAWRWLRLPAQIIAIGNFVLFAFLLVRALGTWPRHLENIRNDLHSPHNTAFYSALGISLLVLGTQSLEIFGGLPVALSLWIPGCLITFGINFAIFFHFFINPDLELTHFTPVFFIPVGGLAVIPAGGCAIMASLSGWAANTLLLANIAALGSAFLLYAGLFSLMLQRLFLLEPLPDKLAPTVWIHMAPIGWGAIGLLGIGRAICGSMGGEICRLLASLLWGGCVWWLVMAGLLTLRSLLRGQLRFTPAFWAFIFPVGALAILSYKLGEAFRLFFYGVWGLLALLWLICVAGTLLHLNYFADACKN